MGRRMECEMEGKGEADSRFKEVHLRRSGGDREVKRATCLALTGVHVLPHLVHITALKGGIISPILWAT